MTAKKKNPKPRQPKSKQTKGPDWSRPLEVTDLDMSFPAHVIGRLLPPMHDIPGSAAVSEWKSVAHQWFLKGLDGILVAKPGIDLKAAVRQLGACLGSYEPQYQHKIAGVAYLMSLWFDSYTPSANSEATEADDG